MPKHRKRTRLVLLVTGILAVVVAGVVLYRDEFRRDFESIGKNEQGYAEYRHRQTGIVMVSVPGGTFQMGSKIGLSGFMGVPVFLRSVLDDKERPQHPVYLDPFLIAKYEVSQKEWAGMFFQNNSRFRGEHLPVEMVTWKEAKKFCSRTGLRLPTEAQWEYACKAETETPFAFGETLTKAQANIDSKSTVRVDSYFPNGFGIHNMHGNVFEHCEDVWDKGFYSKPEATEPNPLCTTGSHFRSARGGGFIHRAPSCRSSSRSRGVMNDRSYYVGFRPAWSSP